MRALTNRVGEAADVLLLIILLRLALNISNRKWQLQENRQM